MGGEGGKVHYFRFLKYSTVEKVSTPRTGIQDLSLQKTSILIKKKANKNRKNK